MCTAHKLKVSHPQLHHTHLINIPSIMTHLTEAATVSIHRLIKALKVFFILLWGLTMFC